MNEFVNLFREKLQNNEKLTKKQADIIDACVELFSEKGFANTSTSDIATKANVAEGTIFKHFGTKQNLLIVTILPIFTDVVTERLIGIIDKASEGDRPVSFDVLIHRFLGEQIKAVGQNVNMLIIFVNELLYSDNFHNELLAFVPIELIQKVNQLLDFYKKDKQIEDLPNLTIIRLIAAPIMSFILLNKTMLHLDREAEQTEIAAIEKFIIKGLSI